MVIIKEIHQSSHNWDSKNKDLLKVEVSVEGEGLSEPDTAMRHMDELISEGFVIDEFYGDGGLDKNKLKGYKMHPKMLGNPDFIFPKKKLVIFIDGDFWHGYNWKKLHKVPPEKYWQAKIKRTIARDKKYTRQLKKAGWKVLRFWENEIKMNPLKCLVEIRSAVSK